MLAICDCQSPRFSKYSIIIFSCLVCTYVINDTLQLLSSEASVSTDPPALMCSLPLFYVDD